MNQQEQHIAEAYSLRGSEKVARKDYLGAIEDFTMAIELQPIGWTYFLRGETLLMMHQNEAALSDFTQARDMGVSIHHDIFDICARRPIHDHRDLVPVLRLK